MKGEIIKCHECGREFIVGVYERDDEEFLCPVCEDYADYTVICPKKGTIQEIERIE